MLDEHGNFLEQANSRVAISPYVKYLNTSQFLTLASSVVDPSDRVTPFVDLVYESKMDFHRVLEDRIWKDDSNLEESPKDAPAETQLEGK